jgi:hypothetical protein
MCAAPPTATPCPPTGGAPSSPQVGHDAELLRRVRAYLVIGVDAGPYGSVRSGGQNVGRITPLGGAARPPR